MSDYTVLDIYLDALDLEGVLTYPEGKRNRLREALPILRSLGIEPPTKTDHVEVPARRELHDRGAGLWSRYNPDGSVTTGRLVVGDDSVVHFAPLGE